ncbi:MAG: dimethyl sulfoxide reductase anchor subunit [Alphaproteobacteria bacterium]|nr:dimethyl sulfoxide reductase anchor subunit [Alphaproteobacteria bacterium]
MHPALSIIFFTTASGAGYGLLALLAAGSLTGHLPADATFGIFAFGWALGLVGAGLLSSLGHLGHPERAWRALTQWRSSWLSREGVAATLTFLPALAFAGTWIVAGRISAPAAALTILGAVATTVCTAMIYASLKPVHAWRNPWTVPIYLLLGLYTGALWLALLVHAFGPQFPAASPLAALLGFAGAAVKRGYWTFLDRSRADSTPETATGLGAIGKVRVLDPPHTESNYLLKEMGYRVARKHAARLRLIVMLVGFGLPVLLSLLADVSASGPAAILSLAAAVSGSLGVVVERWLFFAEARHTVTLYYGASHA